MANEKRLIDANALTDAIEHIDWYHISLQGTLVQGANSQLHTPLYKADDIYKALEDAHTVDAVELPCKIGDKVYRIDKGNYHSNWKPFVEELTVTEISWKKEKYGDKDLGFAIIANGIRYKFTSIGKSVFLTRKEAEAKMDGDGNA